jgi:hypothetical protein
MFRFNQIRSNEPSDQSGDKDSEPKKSSPLSGMGSKPQSSLSGGGASPFSGGAGPGKSTSPFSSAVGGGSILKKTDPASSTSINTGIPKVPQPSSLSSSPAPTPMSTPAPTPVAAPTPIVDEIPTPISTPEPFIEEEKIEIPVSIPEPTYTPPPAPLAQETPPAPVSDFAPETPAPSKGFSSFKATSPFAPPTSEASTEPEDPTLSAPAANSFEETPVQKFNEPAPISTPEPEAIKPAPTPAPIPSATPNKLSFSAPVMGGQEHIDHIRLEIYHEIIRACGTLKKISRAEATSLINITSRAPDGLILPHVSKMISIPPDALQADLLAKDNLAFAPANFFANVLRTTKFEKIRRLLVPYGIVPLFSKDAIITCAMELPHLRDVVIEVSNRHSLGFKWCHAVMFKIKDLQDALIG